MDPNPPLVIALGDAAGLCESIIGGKAAKLARLASEQLAVPPGFCITTQAYKSFVADHAITTEIRMELGRRPMDDMRWEEIWDAALRIRSLFLTHPCSESLRREIDRALLEIDASRPIAVRSSSPSEDASGSSFAGLHESIIGVKGPTAVYDAVRMVWASLWSDAALLYRRELRLDPAQSRMAVLVQQMIDADLSGVAFGCDPRTGNKNRAIIESVPGPCNLLVDGLLDPDRWQMDRRSRMVVDWSAGEREGEASSEPLLCEADLQTILDALQSVENKFHWAPDVEWCGRTESFTVLQARPVTTGAREAEDDRGWHLSLRPGDARLRDMRRRVAEELIPQLEAEGRMLAAVGLESCTDGQLADAIEQRRDAVARWKKIYWDEFIPFAHGVRRLALYYNNAVQPEDPYEFVALLRNQPLIAVRRNQAIAQLAGAVRRDNSLQRRLDELLQRHAGALDLEKARDVLTSSGLESASRFISRFEAVTERYLDITYDHERLSETTESLLRNILELARCETRAAKPARNGADAEAFELRLLTAVGADRHDEAQEVVETGRISWRLRDDDNLLVARLESQLLRALEIGGGRLRTQGRMTGSRALGAGDAGAIAYSLRNPSAPPIELKVERGESKQTPRRADNGETPRQLLGQPASPGISTGRVRLVRGGDDLGRFKRGEVLVCDAIQPTMTHLVPLASAIVERRGGMLIHGAIIARELGIPCVNGVRGAAEVFNNGDLVTVDGNLGIVTLGAPEFDMELRSD